MAENFKKIRKEVVKLILNDPRARERRLRNKAIGAILLKKYKLDISQNMMAKIVKDAESGTRAWRAFLKENPEFRGSDYFKDKHILEQERKIDLGYVPGLYEQIKILKKL